MKQNLLAPYIQTGFPYFREISKLPEWLVPGAAEVVSQLGDESLLELIAPLDLTGEIQSCLAKPTGANKLPVEEWREAIERWYAVCQVVPVTMALLRAREKVEAMERRGVFGINSTSVVRSLATIAFAIFIPNGGKILGRLAVVLDGNPTEPAELLNRYVTALVNDDKDILSRIEECIQRDPMWTTWFVRFSDCALAFPYLPRVIGVSPVPSNALIPLLATMFKEVTDADCSRDNAN
jgi:hypothetical protein